MVWRVTSKLSRMHSGFGVRSPPYPAGNLCQRLTPVPASVLHPFVVMCYPWDNRHIPGMTDTSPITQWGP